MASYRIEFRRSALKDLRRLDRQVVSRLIDAVEKLADEPRPAGVRKLVGSEHTYRIRAGDYRIVYSVDDALLVVSIERARHRKDAYH